MEEKNPVPDTGAMQPPDPAEPIRSGALDPRTAALLWLLFDGGVPLVVAGPASAAQRMALAGGLLSLDPARRWIVLDAEEEGITAERLGALIRGGSGVGITLRADDLEGVLESLMDGGLPEDAVRRLGVVAIATESPQGLRCTVVHYLRPTERDAQGHLQRRPPAVLAAWDERGDTFEDYAWGITPELADRIDRSQADLEERQADRARFLARLETTLADYPERVRTYLATEPPRVPAPVRPVAKPSPFSGGLTDPESHEH
jgi:hypothetical protein